ncbi:MAG: hypothetical protein FD180_2241 [Planctomycetota bacterium]|nr:MAG: hypothetical protein FD180_2241 [Planctomycetota bacterium]
MELRRVSDCVWEIPKTGAMRVPGRIYADKRLLDLAKGDKALDQVVNVATLPGIVKWSLAMPDIHWGYGFPIGGVAAFSLDEGVISPGGVGYDINCIAGGTRVLSADGSSRPIRELVESQVRGRVASLAGRDRKDTQVVAGLARTPRSRVLELVTASGSRIVATEDHRILSPNGWRTLGALQPGDRVAGVGFDGVPWEDPGRRIIAAERELRITAKRLGKHDRGNAVTQALAAIEKLLPLTFDHPALPVLLKVTGLVLGDGSIHFEAGEGKGRVSISGRREDLESVAHDLRPWIRVSPIHERTRDHRIRTTYGLKEFESTECFIRISNTGFALLLAALGIPVGPKASQDWSLPRFLFAAPPWQRRLFLAGYFGAELTSPAAFVKRNRNFTCPVLTLVKRGPWVKSGHRVLEDVALLLGSLGVRSLTVSGRAEQENPDGSRSHRLRLVIASDIENLTALWGRVGFEYNLKRSRLASRAVVYLRAKSVALARREAAKARILDIRAASGWGAKKTLAAMGDSGINLRFVERTLYGKTERAVRSGDAFPALDEWLKGRTEGDIVWEDVVAVTPRPDVTRVYDIGVASKEHNFVAAGLVVHNCGVRVCKTGLRFNELEGKHKKLVNALFNAVPTGVGGDSAIGRLSREDGTRIVTSGARWAVENGYGKPSDLDYTEDGGTMPGADPAAASDTAFKRGLGQVGTLGSGNHFLELDRVSEVYTPEAESVFGLAEGDVVLLIHCGSRGFGYQICDENVHDFVKIAGRYHIDLADRQLACAPASSHEGKKYLSAMACAANYAWVNRQVIMILAGRAISDCLGRNVEPELIYDVSPPATRSRPRSTRTSVSRCSSPGTWAGRRSCSRACRAQ